jgi:hypothetical protein
VPDEPEELYPEHVKLKAVQHRSQDIKDFLEYCYEQKFELRKYSPGKNFDTYDSVAEDRIRALIAGFVGVDMDLIAKEKEAMVERMVRNAR